MSLRAVERVFAQGSSFMSEPRHRDRPLLAIGLVLASTVFLSCSDVTAKYLASSVPAIEIAWLRYLVFLLIVLSPVLRTGLKRTFRSQRPGLQVFRGLALVTSSILFISSLRYLPIAEATATSFAAPIFITADWCSCCGQDRNERFRPGIDPAAHGRLELGERRRRHPTDE